MCKHRERKNYLVNHPIKRVSFVKRMLRSLQRTRTRSQHSRIACGIGDSFRTVFFSLLLLAAFHPPKRIPICPADSRCFLRFSIRYTCFGRSFFFFHLPAILIARPDVVLLSLFEPIREIVNGKSNTNGEIAYKLSRTKNVLINRMIANTIKLAWIWCLLCECERIWTEFVFFRIYNVSASAHVSPFDILIQGSIRYGFVSTRQQLRAIFYGFDCIGHIPLWNPWMSKVQQLKAWKFIFNEVMKILSVVATQKFHWSMYCMGIMSLVMF